MNFNDINKKEPLIYDFAIDKEKTEALHILKDLSQTSGTELISYYIKEYSDTKLAKIKTERSEAKSIKSKLTQQKVISGLDTLIDALNFLSSNGDDSPHVIFVKDKFKLIMKLPLALGKNSYHCGKVFQLDELEAYSTLEWGILVLDTQEVSIGVLKNNHIQLLQTYSVHIPGKMRAGGQSQMRFEETRKNLVYHHIHSVSEKCNSHFQSRNISKILLGGIIPTVELFYKYNSLTAHHKNLLMEPVTTIYTNRKGLEEVLLKHRSFYETQLQAYFKERFMYEYVVSNRKNYKTQGEVGLLENYTLVEVFKVGNRINLRYYCANCKVAISTSSCINCKNPTLKIEDLSKVNKFNPESEWGQKFLRNYGVLYKIKLNQDINN